MIDHVLAYLRNYFPRWYRQGTFIVSNGSIEVDGLQEDQYFRICGSVFNDGVHRYPASDLMDEVFEGTVFALAIPPALLDVVKDIEVWQEKNGEKAAGPFQSESFGGYSYTLKSGAESGSGSGGFGWESAFKSRLSRWRKI